MPLSLGVVVSLVPKGRRAPCCPSIISKGTSMTLDLVSPHPRPPTASMADRFAQLQREYRDSLRRRYADKHDSEAMIHHAVEGAIKIFDALAIAEALNAGRPARILEVGSYLGFSTRWILEATASIGSSVTSVDPRFRHRIFDGVKEHLLAFCAPHASRLTCVDAYFVDRNVYMLLHPSLKNDTQCY